jgi:hypothetical protein
VLKTHQSHKIGKTAVLSGYVGISVFSLGQRLCFSDDDDEDDEDDEDDVSAFATMSIRSSL